MDLKKEGREGVLDVENSLYSNSGVSPSRLETHGLTGKLLEVLLSYSHWGLPLILGQFP